MDGKNEPDTGRETGTGEMPFMELALFLAESYGQMLSDRERLKAVIDAGVQPYTEEMAIRDLSAVSVRYDTERVQTSNISNVPERIAELLDAGYVKKMNSRLEREMDDAAREYGYICWKIEIVETAMRERMGKKEKAVFERLFVKKRTYRQICDAYRKGTLHNKQVSQTKKMCIRKIAEHLENVSCFPLYSHYMKSLVGEYGRERGTVNEENRQAENGQ